MGEVLESIFENICNTQDYNLDVTILEGEKIGDYTRFFHPESQVAEVQVLGS